MKNLNDHSLDDRQISIEYNFFKAAIFISSGHQFSLKLPALIHFHSKCHYIFHVDGALVSPPVSLRNARHQLTLYYQKFVSESTAYLIRLSLIITPFNFNLSPRDFININKARVVCRISRPTFLCAINWRCKCCRPLGKIVINAPSEWWIWTRWRWATSRNKVSERTDGTPEWNEPLRRWFGK